MVPIYHSGDSVHCFDDRLACAGDVL